jgi:hypothetical protein
MAADNSSSLTPQERLAASRRALVAQLRGHPEADREDLLYAIPPAPAPVGHMGWSAVARGLLRRWWRRHPANAAGQVARPLLERYARESPEKFVAAAAASGALLVLVKPWRLLSITALVAAVLKTSDIADMVTTLMQNNDHPRKDPDEFRRRSTP